METQTNEKDPWLLSNEEKEMLSDAIAISIDIDAAFKLYSFRIITPQVFTDRVVEIIQTHGTRAFKRAKEDYQSHS